MFRAAVLSIVMTLTAGSNASLLCILCCHPDATQAAPCEHRNSTGASSVTVNDSCSDSDATSSAFVREDARRGASASAQQAIAVTRLQFASPASHSTSVPESGQQSAREARPLVLVLRI